MNYGEDAKAGEPGKTRTEKTDPSHAGNKIMVTLIQRRGHNYRCSHASLAHTNCLQCTLDQRTGSRSDYVAKALPGKTHLRPSSPVAGAVTNRGTATDSDCLVIGLA